MTDKKEDEETYSLIFTSLRHPVRRKILRMLENQELTFSEILETLAIDSGHLSYHLESLGSLITHSSDGRYKLSSFGTAALRLMEGVEEYNPPTNSKSTSNAINLITFFSLVLVAVLLSASLICANFITTNQSEVASWPPSIESPFSPIQLALGPNQTFSYPINFTIDRSFTIFSSSGFSIGASRFANSITEWDEYSVALDFSFNQTYQFFITLRESSSGVVGSARWDGVPGRFSGGIGGPITRPDNYTLEIQNIGNNSVQATLGIHVSEQTFQRPLFFYGLAGIITTSLYPVAIVVFWSWRKTKPPNTQNKKRPH